MARDEERIARSQEEPIVGSLPDAPGILTALRLTPALGVHLRGLADELLVDDFAGATITRHQREMLATAALLHIARTVRREPRELTSADVQAALDAGASDQDVQLAVLIASAFSMYNRIVEGFRARTAPTAEVYRERAEQIAEHGYSDGRVAAVPGRP